MKTNYSYPSIFNDVIGPVMRGPSSSHCAASLRIGRLARDLMERRIEEVAVQFDPNGSLAQTHQSQGSDMGLFAGFLGWEAHDERLKDYETAVREAGITIKIEITGLDTAVFHPNTYRLILKNDRETHQLTAISSGGGMIEITEIDGVEVSISGDYYETLVYARDNEGEIVSYLQNNAAAEYILTCKNGDRAFIQVKSRQRLDAELLARLREEFKPAAIKQLEPVLPVLSRGDMTVPYITCAGMLAYNEGKDLDLCELAIHYESTRGGISHGEVVQKMKDIVRLMKQSILSGLEGTEYGDRILGYQSGFFKRQMENKHLLDGGILNRIILYTTAMMEVKSSLGVITAAPTAGSCGALPGSCIGASDELGLDEEDTARAMLAAGMIGIFISAHATFAAEVGGCQAECGAASGMAAAALVTLAGGSTEQAVAAASMALQNILGMTCDPVANRVEVPCLGKNVMAAANALSCANMATANFDPVIPLDEVITAMDEVGKSIAHELRCTALGGLSITRTSKKIEERLKQRR
jgi:L-serine dehydratase